MNNLSGYIPLVKHIARLRKTEAELKAVNAELERTIGIKTAELESTNELLQHKLDELKDSENKLMTAVKSAEDERAKSKSILCAIGDGISIQDRDFRIIYQNQVYKELIGDHIGEFCYRAYAQNDSVCKDCQIAKTFKDGGIHVSEKIIQRKDRIVCLEATTSPLKNPSGDIVAGIEVVRDITRRKESEVALEESRERFRSLFEESPAPMFELDISYVSGYIDELRRKGVSDLKAYCDDNPGDVIRCVKKIKTIDVNRAALTLLQAGSKEDIVKDFWSIFTEETFLLFKESIIMLAEGKLTSESEGTVKSSDGERRYVIAKWTVPSGFTQTRSKALLALTDITESRKLEAQLRHSQKMEAVGQLAGGIAHDFNNVTTSVINFCYVLRMQIGEDDPSRRYVDHIIAASERAADLTRRLLTFSRGGGPAITQPVDLNDIVKEAEKLLSGIIGGDIELCTALSEGPLVITADAGQMDQVLLNLITNAKDAMPSGGHLSVETDAMEIDGDFVRRHGYGSPGAYALLSVTDTGTGMDKQTMKRIFEPFYTTKEVGKGTGLGLAIVYGIINHHNGHINVCSEEGKGTTFRILLPLSGEPGGTKTGETFVPMGGMETILLAEDEENLRALIKGVLEDKGYSVIEAADGREVIQKSREHAGRIDLVILDVIMPQINGREVAEEIKRDNPDARIMLTSWFTDNIINKMEKTAKNFYFMSKPYSTEKLLTKIRDILDEKKHDGPLYHNDFVTSDQLREDKAGSSMKSFPGEML
ncbi:MAG: response regulator [Nitrospirae bacterium]|nr:response regulator [Nitrospirota bacterium]